MTDTTIPGKANSNSNSNSNPISNPTSSVSENKNNDVLIVQSDKRKQRLNFKLRRRVQKGYSPENYHKVLNPKDYNDLALLFEDLDFIIGAPVEKAYRKYKQGKGDGFPFF